MKKETHKKVGDQYVWSKNNGFIALCQQTARGFRAHRLWKHVTCKNCLKIKKDQ